MDWIYSTLDHSYLHFLLILIYVRESHLISLNFYLFSNYSRPFSNYSLVNFSYPKSLQINLPFILVNFPSEVILITLIFWLHFLYFLDFVEMILVFFRIKMYFFYVLICYHLIYLSMTLVFLDFHLVQVLSVSNIITFPFSFNYLWFNYYFSIILYFFLLWTQNRNHQSRNSHIHHLIYNLFLKVLFSFFIPLIEQMMT